MEPELSRERQPSAPVKTLVGRANIMWKLGSAGGSSRGRGVDTCWGVKAGAPGGVRSPVPSESRRRCRRHHRGATALLRNDDRGLVAEVLEPPVVGPDTGPATVVLAPVPRPRGGQQAIGEERWRGVGEDDFGDDALLSRTSRRLLLSQLRGERNDETPALYSDSVSIPAQASV
jgi:hypothetical protein